MGGRPVSPPPADRPAYLRLRELLAKASDIERAQSLLAWDERTGMPAGGGPARAEQMATLSAIHHGLATDPELGRLLDELEPWAASLAPGSTEAAMVRVARRDLERSVLVPVDLRTRMARAESLSEQAWAQAKAESDFASFASHLERMIALRVEYADCMAPLGHATRYDALLDEFEPGATCEQLIPLFARLRAGLVPMVEAIGAAEDGGQHPHDDPLVDTTGHGEFTREAQVRLVRQLVSDLPLGEDPDCWRLDETIHPFATTIAADDIRLTTAYRPGSLYMAIWSTLHEAGHGMYEHGIGRELERTPLGAAPSLGFHESQSRLWENWVGRGRPYCRHLAGRLREAFPGALGELDGEYLYRCANRVERSLIRVEADELTYNLHVALRFELEQAIFAGDIAVADLPAEWNNRVWDYLGLEVPDDAHGVLQDVHWAAGAFGYFPTYSLGNMIAAELWQRIEADLPDLDADLERGDGSQIGGWLREHVHRYGRLREPGETLAVALTPAGAAAANGPAVIDPQPLLDHLAARFGPLYEVGLGSGSG